jgi:hypothetical protein
MLIDIADNEVLEVATEALAVPLRADLFPALNHEVLRSLSPSPISPLPRFGQPRQVIGWGGRNAVRDVVYRAPVVALR